MSHSRENPQVGSRIREYELLELLGRGGMGSVYRARHTLLDEERAIKIVHSRAAGDSDFLQRFIREARILTRLRHPNLVNLHEFGTLEEDAFFMVLEFICGESVLDRIHRLGRIPIASTVRMIREAAAGLECAHEHGVIHRDISPDNLVILNAADTEVIKVIDFGIARPTQDTTRMRINTGSIFIGKPEYSSPEQCGLLQEGETLDPRSDIYSLGITFYHMLCGKGPFQSKSPQGYFLKHAHEIPQPPSTHFPPGEFPQALDHLILKALAKSRDERYSSMKDIIRELDAFAFGTSGTVLSPLDEPQSGEIFANRYLVEKRLGSGEMGIVYRAKDNILGITVALKTVTSHIAEDERTMDRFKREVILARKVAHPSVCRIYDIGEHRGLHYVSMEYVEGMTLGALLQSEGRLAAETGIPFLKQILQGLQETHRVGIVHRDLKPQNIMLEKGVQARIMDFGISISSDVHRVTQTGALVGTPHFMAPELFEGKACDHRADLYSIGVIMYQMFTGKFPFEAPTPVAVIYAHLKSDPVPPSSLVPGFTPELERIILKALQKDPASRYQTVQEMLRDLEPLTEPTTVYGVLGREQIVHRLIAEHRYSQAIRLLRSLLKTDPENHHWQKLLQNAVTEKVGRELRRARSLLRKKNLIHAEMVLKKIDRYKPVSKRVISQREKLESRLIREKETAIQGYLEEAAEFYRQRDYLAALGALDSAWNLQPGDPRLIQMQEQIQQAQEAETTTQFNRRYEEAATLALEGRDREALEITRELLLENPDSAQASGLMQELVTNRRNKQMEKTGQNIEFALQPLSFSDFELSCSLLKKLVTETQEESLRVEVLRIYSAIQEMKDSFLSGRIHTVPDQVQQLLANDPYGWLENCGSFFSEIGRVVAEKKHLRNQARRDAMLEVKTLCEQEEYVKALSVLETLLHVDPDYEDARALNLQIQVAYKQQWLERAGHLEQQGRWEEALQCWKEGSLTFSGDEEFVLKTSALEEKWKQEQVLQEQLIRQIEDCHVLIQRERWTEALRVVVTAQAENVQGQRMQEFEQKLGALRRRITRELDAEEARKRQMQTELEEARRHFREQNFSEALDLIRSVFQVDPLHEDALQLRERIHEEVQERDRTRRFNIVFEKGMQQFEEKNWIFAIHYWKKALGIAENPSVLQCITTAEQQLLQERSLRKQIAGQMDVVEDMIASKDFSDAGTHLQKCREALTQDFKLSDLEERWNRLAGDLEEASREEQKRSDELGTRLSAAMQFFKHEQFEEALLELDGILLEEPEMPEARKLREECVVSIRLLERIRELLAACISALQEWELRRLPRILMKLQQEGAATSYNSELTIIKEEMLQLGKDMEAADSKGVEARLERLIALPLLQPFEEPLRTVLQSSTIRMQKSMEEKSILREAIKHAKERRWVEAIRSFRRLDADEDLAEGQPQDDVKKLLIAAHQALEAGDLERSTDLFAQALALDPQNETARHAILTIEKLTLERTTIRPPQS